MSGPGPGDIRVRVIVRGGVVVDVSFSDLLTFKGKLPGPWPQVHGGPGELVIDVGWVDVTDAVWNPLIVPESPQVGPWAYDSRRDRAGS